MEKIHVFLLSITVAVVILVYLINLLQNHITKRKKEKQKLIDYYYNQRYSEYIKSFKSGNKNKTIYLGKLYYGYFDCNTIFQQNNILLQIQNDILLHS